MQTDLNCRALYTYIIDFPKNFFFNYFKGLLDVKALSNQVVSALTRDSMFEKLCFTLNYLLKQESN